MEKLLNNFNMDELTIENVIVWAKTLGYFFAVLCFDYIGIPKEQFTILGTLMVIDVLTGLLKAKKLDPTGETLTSERLTDGVVKKCLIIVLVFTVGITAKGVDITPEHFLQWTLGVLILAECYSIIQNIYTQRTGKRVHEYDAITFAIQKLGEVLLGLLKKLIKSLWSN